MNTLLFFSGGLDSTYIAYKILTETDDNLTLITLERKKTMNVYFAKTPEENLRLESLVEELRKIRDFVHIRLMIRESHINHDTMHTYTYLIHEVYPKILDKTYDRIAIGQSWEQHNQKVMRSGDLGLPSYIASKRLLEKLGVNPDILWAPLITHDFVNFYSRFDAWEELSENISSKTMSCVYPSVSEDGTTTENCGQCHRCLWDEKMKEFKKSRKTKKFVENWRIKKSEEYGANGKTAPMRAWLPIEMKKGSLFQTLDTKEKVQNFVKENDHYTLSFRKKEGIWDI